MILYRITNVILFNITALCVGIVAVLAVFSVLVIKFIDSLIQLVSTEKLNGDDKLANYYKIFISKTKLAFINIIDIFE